MLKRRLIPKLQMVAAPMGNTERMILVTTRNFNEIIPVGDPVSQAKIYESQAADELILVDIRPDVARRPLMLSVLQKLSAEIFMPFTVGGGVNHIDDFRLFLSHGADKVSINSAAVSQPDLIAAAADRYGAQCVVVSIDYKLNNKGVNEVFTHGGTVATGLHPVEWAGEAVKRGAGEILLTCIDRDGTSTGLDVETSAAVAAEISVPLIIGGGCGLSSHFVDGFLSGHADAVSAGTFFCFRDQNPMQTRSHIANAGISIRTHF
jgi:imidazole glycerol-phosphate synthase subunit HisF